MPPRFQRQKSFTEFIDEVNDVDLNTAKSLFEAIDVQNEGTIDSKKLKRVFKELNVDVSEREIDDLMYQLDADGDGIVKFEEWKNGILFIQRAFGLDTTDDNQTTNNDGSRKQKRLSKNLSKKKPERRGSRSAKRKSRDKKTLGQSKLSIQKMNSDPDMVLSDSSPRKSAGALESPKYAAPASPKLAPSRLVGDQYKVQLSGGGDDEFESAASHSVADDAAKASQLLSIVKASSNIAAADAAIASTHDRRLDDTTNNTDTNNNTDNNDNDNNHNNNNADDDEQHDDGLPFVAPLPRKHSSVAGFIQQLTPVQYQEIETLFNFHDQDGVGRVSFAALEEIIRSVDPDLPDSEVKQFMAQVDTEGTPDIGFQQFMRSMHALFKALRLKKKLRNHKNKTRPTRPSAAAPVRQNSYQDNTLNYNQNPEVLFQEASVEPVSLSDEFKPNDEFDFVPMPRREKTLASLAESQSAQETEEVSPLFGESAQQTSSVDEALWRHVEMLEDELAAARQEILLLSKLAKARRRETLMLNDPSQMAELLVRMAQRDGEAGERASHALASSIATDERLVRRIVREAAHRDATARTKH